MDLEIISREPENKKNQTPVLFVHGMWDSAKSWSEHFLNYFAQNGFHAHALSLRGHGASERKGRLRWASLSDYVDDVAEVIAQLEHKPVLVGHSMGGVIVQKYLETCDLPAAVLMATPPPKGVLAATLTVARRYPLAFMQANLTLSLYPIIGDIKRFRELLFSEGLPEEKLAEYFSRMQDESYRAYLDMLGLNLPKPALVKAKILVLGAANDPIATPVVTTAVAAAYGTTPVIVPDMSHFMMLESNWRDAADSIIDWVRENNI